MITIDSDFENGSLDRAIKLGENCYQLVLRPDGWYWFHCRIRGCKNKEVIFQLQCTNNSVSPCVHNGLDTWDFGKGIYNQPVVSYDKKTWTKIKQVEKDRGLIGTFRFRHTFAEDEAYLCYTYPYTYAQFNEYLQKIKHNPLVKMESLGKTRTGIDQPVLTITKNTSSKNVALVIAREDATEMTGSYAVEGLINHLLDKKDKSVSNVLNKYVFKIVPMVGIGGVIAGAGFSDGYGYGGFRWHESPAPAEIENIKQALKKWIKKDGAHLRIACKIHGCYTFMSFNPDIGLSDRHLQASMASTRGKFWNPVIHDLAIRPKGYFERYLLDEYGVSASCYIHANGTNPDNVRKCGEHLCIAMEIYLLKARNQ
jgi:hypothetical protein